MNARDEFLEFIKDKPGVICAEIEQITPTGGRSSTVLPIGFDPIGFDLFCESFTKCVAFSMYGTVWFADGSCGRRCGNIYDGSEFWKVFQSCPEIPASLKGEES